MEDAVPTSGGRASPPVRFRFEREENRVRGLLIEGYFFVWKQDIWKKSEQWQVLG